MKESYGNYRELQFYAKKGLEKKEGNIAIIRGRNSLRVAWRNRLDATIKK
jgi:hypothetical protein